MPKFLSSSGGRSPSGTHLYPSQSVEEDDERSSNNRIVGSAVGRAYCGVDGQHENVFAPAEVVDRPRTLLGFERESWSNTCEECASIVRSGKLTDREWMDDFRAGVVDRA